jgi:xanthine/uracil permease
METTTEETQNATNQEQPEPIASQPDLSIIFAFFAQFLQSKEASNWSRLIRRIHSFNKIWDDIFQTIITIGIAIGVVWVLMLVQEKGLIDKSTFGVMFGTVIGYVLSWRFGK